MRITIWQQYSSNHSSDFTVVGTFQTHEAAENAAQQFRSMLATIVNWYKLPENRAVAREVLNNYEFPPVPPELQIAEQFGIEWPTAVVWLPNISIERIETAVL